MEIESEAEVLQAFEKIRKKFFVRGVEFHKAVRLPEMTIISCRGKIGALIGRKGMGVHELGRELNAKVRVVEQSKDGKKVVLDLIGNTRLLGLNEVFTPEGKTLKIIIDRRDSGKMDFSAESLKKAAEELLETKISVEFR
ncbi:MAG TPA: hypothetical protein VFF09_02600 [archaeon]|nr:hypothetical protein [archaeon]